MYLSPFQFVLEEISATQRSTRALGVIGVHAHIDFRYKYALPANLDQFGPLIHHLRTRPTIRIAVLLFTSLHNLKQAIQASTHVLDPVVTGSSTLVLMYEEEEERRAVGVDLITLEPDGAYSAVSFALFVLIPLSSTRSYLGGLAKGREMG